MHRPCHVGASRVATARRITAQPLWQKKQRRAAALPLQRAARARGLVPPARENVGTSAGGGALRECSACAAARAWRPAKNRPLRTVGRWPRLVPSHIRLSGRVSGASAAACRGKWLTAKHCSVAHTYVCWRHFLRPGLGGKATRCPAASRTRGAALRPPFWARGVFSLGAALSATPRFRSHFFLAAQPRAALPRQRGSFLGSAPLRPARGPRRFREGRRRIVDDASCGHMLRAGRARKRRRKSVARDVPSVVALPCLVLSTAESWPAPCRAEKSVRSAPAADARVRVSLPARMRECAAPCSTSVEDRKSVV